MHFNGLVLWEIFQLHEEARNFLSPFISGRSLARAFCQSQYSALHPHQGLREQGKPLTFWKTWEPESKKLADILNMAAIEQTLALATCPKSLLELIQGNKGTEGVTWWDEMESNPLSAL